jgi:glucan phosphoethanolaminetransferase (alkaline phosphatase superfamily)
VAKMQLVCILYHSKQQFPLPYGLKALFAAFFLGSVVWCYSILSFCFHINMMKPAVITSHDAVKEAIVFHSIQMQKL